MNLNQVALYAPYLGGLLFTFGIVRIFIRSDVDFGSGISDAKGKQRNSDDRGAIWNALWSRTGRFDLAAMGLGLAIILIFIASIR